MATLVERLEQLEEARDWMTEEEYEITRKAILTNIATPTPQSHSPPGPFQQWVTHDRRILLDRSPRLVIEEHTVELPDGRIFDDWTYVVTPEYINILPVSSKGEFMVLKQVKYAVTQVFGTPTLATVGGLLDPGESPSESAKRELREEMGLDVEDLVPLGKYSVDGNRGAGVAHLFLGLGAHPAVKKAASDDLEEMETITLDEATLEENLKAGEFKLLSWSLCVSLGLMHWRKGKEERQRRVAEDLFLVFGSHEEAIMSPKSHKPRQDIAGEFSLSD